jgi:NADH dehydrogenase
VRVLITGANGHLGRRLVRRLAPDVQVTATVRSTSARRVLESMGTATRIVELDYRDTEALAAAAADCDCAVHLAGILKETAANRYVDAHERTTEALLAAAASQLRRVVYVSILGADPRSPNAALASKGRAERTLLESAVPALVVRVPMVLGEDDYAARALRSKAASGTAFLLRGTSLEQPIYSGDVVEAIVAGLALPGSRYPALDLAGPVSLSRAELVRRAAACIGRRVRCVSLPLAPVLGIAWLLQRLMSNPPVTPAMLGVLDHDDCIDPAPAAARLGIRLTGLDDMLRRCVGGKANGAVQTRRGTSA